VLPWTAAWARRRRRPWTAGCTPLRSPPSSVAVLARVSEAASWKMCIAASKLWSLNGYVLVKDICAPIG
jgi:hypothetical protein